MWIIKNCWLIKPLWCNCYASILDVQNQLTCKKKWMKTYHMPWMVPSSRGSLLDFNWRDFSAQSGSRGLKLAALWRGSCMWRNWVSRYFSQKSFSNSSILNDTHIKELDSVQKFIEIQGWLLLTFFICLHNQLSSFNSIIVQMPEKHDSSSRQ